MPPEHIGAKKWQFGLPTLMLVVVVAAVVALVLRSLKPVRVFNGPELSDYLARLQPDRIILRDAGQDATEEHPILAEITDPSEVQMVRSNLKFKSPSSGMACACYGFPAIEWYRGDRQLAVVSVQHREALRWRGWRGDADLTPASSAWLGRWLDSYGVGELPSDESVKISHGSEAMQ